MLMMLDTAGGFLLQRQRGGGVSRPRALLYSQFSFVQIVSPSRRMEAISSSSAGSSNSHRE